ncbi:hypothetical protein LTR94_035809, partial [Friedmanniomyces endolithicus]
GARLHARNRHRHLHRGGRRQRRLGDAGALAPVAPAGGAVARGGAVVRRPDPAVGAVDDSVPARPELRQELRRRGPADRGAPAGRHRLHRDQCRPGPARLAGLLRTPAF